MRNAVVVRYGDVVMGGCGGEGGGGGGGGECLRRLALLSLRPPPAAILLSLAGEWEGPGTEGGREFEKRFCGGSLLCDFDHLHHTVGASCPHHRAATRHGAWRMAARDAGVE